jgi:hypothetical protein
MDGCVEAALGPLTGYVAGTLLWVGDLLISTAGLLALAAGSAAGHLLQSRFVARRAS